MKSISKLLHIEILPAAKHCYKQHFASLLNLFTHPVKSLDYSTSLAEYRKYVAWDTVEIAASP